MTARFIAPSREAIQRAKEASERALSPADFDAYVRAPWGDGEREHTLELVAWFTQRYPSPLDRLRAARRTMQRAQKRMPA